LLKLARLNRSTWSSIAVLLHCRTRLCLVREGSALDELNATENSLLPDLFDGKEQEKPVDIKGRVLIDESADDISGPLDGAEMSIEIKSDRLPRVLHAVLLPVGRYSCHIFLLPRCVLQIFQ